MRFRAAHKMTTYLMVGAAIGTLALSDGLSSMVAALLILAAVVSWWAEPGMRLGVLIARVDVGVKLLTVGYFLYAVLSIYRAFPEPEAEQLTNLILFLIGLKLLQRRTNRDYLHLHVLSFLLILASAWLAQSVFFAIGFVAYVIAALWALILFHLRREIEENYLVKHSQVSPTQRVTVTRVLDSRRVVSGRFFAVTALVSLVVLAGSVLVFALAPRIGLGFLTGGIRRRTAVAGFSDQVRLGQHGRISSENQVVVLRVNVPRLQDLDREKRDQEIANLYWRGTVYDRYVDGQWLRSRSQITRTKLDRRPSQSGGRLWFVSGAEMVRDQPLRYADLEGAEAQEIQVVGLTHPVAFALDTPIAYEVDTPQVGAFTSTSVEERWSGESALVMVRAMPSGNTVPLTNFTGASYRAYSRDTVRGARRDLTIPIADWPQELADAYLSVPQTISKRTHDLARKITANETTAAGKARAVIAWLQENKRYTTDLERDDSIPDPVEDFLFQQKAGHCEYFASSLALLLRLVGVPTRYVNGFLGGEWNDLTRFITIRDNRAHSWVEGYFDGFGWTRLDATPAASWTTRMSPWQEIVDSIELWWASWVLEYDAARQVRLARDVAKGLGLRNQRGTSIDWPRPSGKQVLLGAALGVAAWFLWQRRRRGTDRPVPTRRGRRKTPALRFYARAVVLLGRAGVIRTDSETPRELLARARRELGDPLICLATITDAYEKARFGGRELDAAEVQALEGHIQTLQTLLREKRSRPTRTAA